LLVTKTFNLYFRNSHYLQTSKKRKTLLDADDDDDNFEEEDSGSDFDDDEDPDQIEVPGESWHFAYHFRCFKAEAKDFRLQ